MSIWILFRLLIIAMLFLIINLTVKVLPSMIIRIFLDFPIFLHIYYQDPGSRIQGPGPGVRAAAGSRIRDFGIRDPDSSSLSFNEEECAGADPGLLPGADHVQFLEKILVK